ncbi:MAG: hypothetical protein LBP50_08100, partial [Tannerella sp.]|nr:hypothetical protein [Tannerella sp.]
AQSVEERHDYESKFGFQTPQSRLEQGLPHFSAEILMRRPCQEPPFFARFKKNALLAPRIEKKSAR